MPFVPLMRMARAWLDEPDAGKLGALVAEGRGVSGAVPGDRQADFAKLLAGLEAGGDKTRARVEGLVRACRLFVREAARDEKLGPLAPVDVLPGLGPTARTALAEHGLSTVADLVWLPPIGWDDLRSPVSLAEAVGAARAAYDRGEAGLVRPPRVVIRALVKSGGVVPIRGRRCVRLVLRDTVDEKCTLHAFWFFLAHGVLNVGKPGAEVLVVGRVRVEKGKPPRTAHPEIFTDAPESRVVRPRYAKLGPTEAALRKAVAHAVNKGICPDPVPAAIVAREAMPEAAPLLSDVHATGGELPSGESRRAFVERLAWAEAFTRVWERVASESREGRAPSPVLPPRASLVRELERELGFTFTAGQRDAIAAIAKDLAEPRPMRRLLLGDVGTGKTAVALAAAAQCVAAGHQVAILAPTSVLAEQYLDAVKPLERASGAKIAFVVAGVKASARQSALAALESGDAAITVGTHALLREGVTIPKLALVVVDEQQRLGVAQRLSLVKKGARPHLLTLSATPIPRTLALALRGELATSSLRERPAGRPPVATELAPRAEIDAVVRRVDEACARAERVFWVVPRIEAEDDDDDDPLASATHRAEALASALPGRKVVMLHGGMKADDKRAVMRAFRSGEAQVLVGTTVIEVGVDVPEATLMVVEDAERFGLAQLHQLRGRVGRGERPGACVLLHGEPLEGPAKGRLVAMTEMSTGEEIARADLDLRGAGDLGGTRQHGAEEELLFLDPGASYAWLERVEEDARALHATDPTLGSQPALASLVLRLRHVLAVREEAG